MNFEFAVNFAEASTALAFRRVHGPFAEPAIAFDVLETDVRYLSGGGALPTMDALWAAAAVGQPLFVPIFSHGHEEGFISVSAPPSGGDAVLAANMGPLDRGFGGLVMQHVGDWFMASWERALSGRAA